MIQGIYLTSEEDSIWFKNITKVQAKITSESPLTKDGIRFEVEFDNYDLKDRFDESLRHSSDVKVLS